jgi:hypothetical protein
MTSPCTPTPTRVNGVRSSSCPLDASGLEDPLWSLIIVSIALRERLRAVYPGYAVLDCPPNDALTDFCSKWISNLQHLYGAGDATTPRTWHASCSEKTLDTRLCPLPPRQGGPLINGTLDGIASHASGQGGWGAGIWQGSKEKEG